MEELMAEVVSSLEDCLGWKGAKPPWMMQGCGSTDVWPPRSKTPRRGRRDISAERALAKAREAPQRALTTMATMEEEIEWLSQSITRGQSEAHAHSSSQDGWRWKSRGQKRRHHQVWLKECHAPYFKYHPPWRCPDSKEDEEAPMDSNLEALPELGPEVNCFLQGPSKSLGEEDRTSSPEPPVEELENWVIWRAQRQDTSGWWQELAEVPEVGDHSWLSCSINRCYCGTPHP